MADTDIDAGAIEFGFAIQGWSDIIRHITISANHIIFETNIVAGFHSDSPLPLNPLLNTYFNCNGYDRIGDPFQGRLQFDMEVSGESADNWINANLSFNLSLSGEKTVGIIITATTIAMEMTISTDGVHIAPEKNSWLKWSNIGSLSFDQGHDNIAGERPLYHIGTIYDLIKLDKSIIVYGSKGIIKVIPIENTWKPERIISIGSQNKHAQIGTMKTDIDGMQWCVDLNGSLWEITNGNVIDLGYKEYLKSLGTVILSLDEHNSLLYICDGTTGYVYSYKDKSLSSGPSNITGINYSGSTKYVVSPAAIVLPTIGFTTGIYDLGTRKEKDIFNIEISTEGSKDMEVRIAYRMDMRTTFAYSPWATFTPQGIAYLKCFCREFKLEFKMSTYEKVYIDQMKVNGVIYGFSHLDIKRR